MKNSVNYHFCLILTSKSLITYHLWKTTNKGISEISLFDPILLKMDCPLFGVTTVLLVNRESYSRIWVKTEEIHGSQRHFLRSKFRSFSSIYPIRNRQFPTPTEIIFQNFDNFKHFSNLLSKLWKLGYLSKSEKYLIWSFHCRDFVIWTNHCSLDQRVQLYAGIRPPLLVPE